MNSEPSIRRRISPNENLWIKTNRASKERVLLIGDPHEPFCKTGYLQHCIDTYKRFNCNKVIFTGDIIDNHYSSFHPTDPDGFGAGEELDRAKAKLQQWYQAFPDAIVMYGNHDLLPIRKAFANGVSGQWLKSFNNVLGVGNGWEFKHEYVWNDILFVHGTGTSGMNAARKRAQEMAMSVVIGHIHTESSISWHTNHEKRFFAMIVGAGMDNESYAAMYAKNFPRRSVLACGIILDDGTLPICVPMDM